MKPTSRGGNLKEAWQVVQKWYHQAREVAPQRNFQTLEKQTNKRVQLYGLVPSPGGHTPINVDKANVANHTLNDDEIREAVKGLSNGRAGGVSKIRAEDIKLWLTSAKAGEKVQRNGEAPAGGDTPSDRDLLSSSRRCGNAARSRSNCDGSPSYSPQKGEGNTGG